jgi:branched-chain amino acid transport system permease protein
MNTRPVVIAIVAGGLAALPLLTANTYFHHVMVMWLMFSLLALSLNIIIGYLGELSFAHAAFFGVGAYASTLITMQAGAPILVGLVVAALIAGVLGFAIGYVSLRIVGPQFAILTLGFGSIIYTVTNYWVDLTRGPMGIANIPRLSVPGYGELTEAREVFYLMLIVVAALCYACHALMTSRTGRAFLASRENAPLAASIGIDVFMMKLLGFVAATSVAGIAGGFYAHYLRVITPELMSLHYVAALIIMVIVGGRGTIVGPIIGALIYVVLLELLRSFGTLRLVIFAGLLTFAVIFLPDGIVSLWQRSRTRTSEEGQP